MYLANFRDKAVIHYQIRQSILETKGGSSYKLIFDLGANPEKFIELFEDHVVFFDSDLLQAVCRHSEKNAESILENLLWDFLPRTTKEQISRFKRHDSRRVSPLSTSEKNDIANQIHIFDRRRLYYLRYGAVDQSRLTKLHEKCCRPLLGQCRDEREYYFTAEETVLSPGDYQQYIYAIFNIQKHFHQSFAPWFPEALASDEVADYFVSELCRLNSDKRFWQSTVAPTLLHPHLRRYLILFFDFAPARRSYLENVAKSFMSDHRTFRWPDRKPSQSPEKIRSIFATPYDQLQQMTKEQLNKLYRQKAMDLHPDKGGDHDLFVELTEIYTELLQSIR